MSTAPQVRTNVFQAVADPTRRAILDQLCECEHSFGALAAPFDMTRPAVSQHLRILRDAELVRVRRSGRQRIYRVNAQRFRELLDWTDKYRRLVDPSGHVWGINPKQRSVAQPGSPDVAADN